MTYGYARISRKTQDINRQIRNIKELYPDAAIVEEAYTGTKIHREKFDALLDKVKEGDTIVFDSVSRMSRDADDGTELYFTLYDKGVNLVFIKEHNIDTDSYKKALNGIVSVDVKTGTKATDNLVRSVLDAVNEFMCAKIKDDIRIAFAQSEKEVKDLQQRTKEGLVTAKLNGKRVGANKGDKYNVKKKEEMMIQIKKYSKDFDGNLTDIDVIKLTGLARNTYYKYKKELSIIKGVWM